MLPPLTAPHPRPRAGWLAGAPGTDGLRVLEAQALLREPGLTFWAMVRKTGRSWSETPVVAPMRMVLLIQTRPARGRRQSFSTPRSATQAL